MADNNLCIYIIEDNILYTKLLKKAFINNEFFKDYEIKSFLNFDELFEKLDDGIVPKLFIIDQNLGVGNKTGIEGIQLLKSNNKFKKVPCMILTAESKDLYLEKGYDAGADDFLFKDNVDTSEIVIRAKYLITKTETILQDNNEIFYDLVANEYYVNNNVIRLTAMQKKTLDYLMDNVDKTIKREDMIMAVWETDQEMATRALDMHISQIRKLINEHSKYEHIITVKGIGYKFVL